MPIQLTEEYGGKILVVNVSGKLAQADFECFGPEFDRLVGRHGKLRVLFDLVDFHGWKVGAAWQDFKFSLAHFAHIERLAIVGETKWQHGMATCFRPFTKAAVRYFDHADFAKARRWLEEGGTFVPTDAFEQAGRES